MKKVKFLKYLLTLTVLVVLFSLIVPSLGYADSRSDVEAFVSRLYVKTLGRTPDSSGLNGWVDQLLSGRMSGAEVASGFVFSAELTGRNVSNEEFLNIMYGAFFDRAPDAAGYSGWLSSMASGASRQAVFSGFVNSTEFRNLCASYGINAGSVSVSGATAAAPAAEKAVVPISANINEYEARVLALLNAVRAQNGLGPLAADQSLTDISRGRSADMIARGYFAHTNPDGTNIFNILRASGISYSAAGENLAQATPAAAGSPEAFVNAWLASPSHRANILKGNYSKIGIGLVDGNGRRVVTTVFMN